MEENKNENIDLNNLTPMQSVKFITNAIRQIPLTYDEHVYLEQCRQIILTAIVH